MIGGAAEPVVTLEEAQAFARIETGEEEALVAGLVRTASALCESFLGQALIEREVTESLAASRQWQRLKAAPVRALTQVSIGGISLPVSDYAIDIDANGNGWVRIVDPRVTGAVEVSATVGMASHRNAIPEPIRQGVLRLVAYLFAARDGDGAGVPAAVTALWRPYRRMGLC